MTQYKYVGTVFTIKRQDIFKSNKSYLAQKAQNALFALNSDVKNSSNHLLSLAAMKMFDVQIQPIFKYAHEIWCNGKVTKEHEQIHLAYMKNKLNVKRLSSTNDIYAEFGRFPLIIKQKVQVLKYWQRLLSLPHEHVLKQSNATGVLVYTK